MTESGMVTLIVVLCLISMALNLAVATAWLVVLSS